MGELLYYYLKTLLFLFRNIILFNFFHSFKIIIRGKGSIKEGKIGSKTGAPLPGEDEPLHAYITGANYEVVEKACEKVREIVNQAIEQPGTENDLRKTQLRELALLNGTLRENDSLNKLKIISQANTIITNTIICGICGGAGHITSDCKLKNADTAVSADGTVTIEKPLITWSEREKMDSEYMSLMAELGQGEKPDASKMAQAKCIISRNGGPASGMSLAIESGNNKNSPSNDYSNSPHSSDVPTEEFLDGRKVIDMTKLNKPPANQGPPQPVQPPPFAPLASSMPRKPPGFLAQFTQPSEYENSNNASNDPASIANAAYMYSQHMNYYNYGSWPMPPYMPPGQQPWGWNPAAASGIGAPPPPPPPPPPGPPPE